MFIFMLVKETLYTLNDVTIVPAEVSDISSRSLCNPYYDDTKMLPIFVSPMNNIVDDNNFQSFLDAGVNVITPRDNENTPYSERRERWEQLWKRGIFVALSLREFEQFFIEFKDYTEPDFNITYTRHVCVDLANGHMKRLLDACKQVKKSFGNKVIIMTGNIANPDTYKDYAKAGIDYVRCGIGTGSICTTAANSAIHYPMASLIETCKHYKKDIELELEQRDIYDTSYISAPKIVADGGFTNFDQIIKALALGADYCMCGKLFAQCIEACTSIMSDKDFFEWPNEEKDKDGYPHCHSTIHKPYNHVDFVIELMEKGYSFHRDYYGMSTKRAQKEMGGKGNKTAEGIAIKIPVKYSVAGWIDNFNSYLKSAMSYTGFRRIEDFIGGPTCKIISNNSYLAYFK